MSFRQDDYNFINAPAKKKYLESFPYKMFVSNWNHLSIDLKSTADATDFQQLLKDHYLSKYNSESQCEGPCFSCDAD